MHSISVDFNFVSVHHPIYADGSHGIDGFGTELQTYVLGMYHDPTGGPPVYRRVKKITLR